MWKIWLSFVTSCINAEDQLLELPFFLQAVNIFYKSLLSLEIWDLTLFAFSSLLFLFGSLFVFVSSRFSAPFSRNPSQWLCLSPLSLSYSLSGQIPCLYTPSLSLSLSLSLSFLCPPLSLYIPFSLSHPPLTLYPPSLYITLSLYLATPSLSQYLSVSVSSLSFFSLSISLYLSHSLSLSYTFPLSSPFKTSGAADWPF